jgi:hypothetical protein
VRGAGGASGCGDVEDPGARGDARPAAIPRPVAVVAGDPHPAVALLVPSSAAAASGWEAEPVGSLRVDEAEPVSSVARHGGPAR